MKKVIVIGLGNTLRSDDGLGARAAALLSQRNEMQGIEIMEVQQLTPEMADYLQDCDMVIFIDASYEDKPGRINLREITADDNISSGFTHHFSPERLLLLAREIYGRSPQAFLFTVGAETFELGEELSPPVQSVMTELINRVIDLIRREQLDN